MCVCESFVTLFARNVLTESCEACLASKICQQLCRVVSLGGVVKYCLLVLWQSSASILRRSDVLVRYGSTLTAGLIPAFLGLFSVDWSMNETPAGGVSSAGEAGNKVRQGTVASSDHA